MKYQIAQIWNPGQHFKYFVPTRLITQVKTPGAYFNNILASGATLLKCDFYVDSNLMHQTTQIWTPGEYLFLFYPVARCTRLLKFEHE